MDQLSFILHQKVSYLKINSLLAFGILQLILCCSEYVKSYAINNSNFSCSVNELGPFYCEFLSKSNEPRFPLIRLQREKHSESVLEALIQGLDDHDAECQGEVALQAMLGLSQVLPTVQEAHIRDIQVAIALRVKPFFEKVLVDDFPINIVANFYLNDFLHVKLTIPSSKSAYFKTIIVKINFNWQIRNLRRYSLFIA